MTEIYMGESLSDAYLAIAEDLKGMLAIMRVVGCPKRSSATELYTRAVIYRQKDLIGATGDRVLPSWRAILLARTNELLHEIHGYFGLPLWQYVVKNHTKERMIVVLREGQRRR